MAAANTDKFKKAKRKFSTTTSGVFSAGATTLPLTSTSGLDTDTAITLVIDAGTASEEVITGVVSGSNIVNCVRGKEGTSDVSHADGAAVTMYFTETHWDDLITGILVSHNQDGTLANNSVTAASITDGVVTNAKLNSDLQQGWINLNDTPDTITHNGNRNYDLVFNSVDLSNTVSPGQKLKLTRTVAAPTQCTDLESSSSQYYSKTSPAGLTFTTTFTCMAWIKLESYGADMGIIARRNADTEGFSFGIDTSGRVVLAGLRIASNNKQIVSYQSIPLNKWVHVAAAIDMTAGDTAAQAIWIDGVSVARAYTLTGTASALVQGTTALVVGALKSAGTNPFDGKIAQAAVFSSVLTGATVRSYASQGLSGSETNLVSAYSFNNSINDLNTTNANNLTANGSAVATNADSPFANAVTAGTEEYAEVLSVTFSTNTTVVVRVPDTCMIPTSGGISNTYYAVGVNPYGLPYFSNELAAYYFKVGASNTASNTNLNGYSITYTLDSKTKYRLSVRGVNVGLYGGATAVCATFVRIREGSNVLAESGIVVQETALGNSATHNVSTNNFTPTSGSHTYVVTLANNNAQAMTYGGVPIEGAVFILEKA